MLPLHLLPVVRWSQPILKKLDHLPTYIPSRKLTYPTWGRRKIIFKYAFKRGNMLIPCRVYSQLFEICENKKSLKPPPSLQTPSYHHTPSNPPSPVRGGESGDTTADDHHVQEIIVLRGLDMWKKLKICSPPIVF